MIVGVSATVFLGGTDTWIGGLGTAMASVAGAPSHELETQQNKKLPARPWDTGQQSSPPQMGTAPRLSGPPVVPLKASTPWGRQRGYVPLATQQHSDWVSAHRTQRCCVWRGQDFLWEVIPRSLL